MNTFIKYLNKHIVDYNNVTDIKVIVGKNIESMRKLTEKLLHISYCGIENDIIYTKTGSILVILIHHDNFTYDNIVRYVNEVNIARSKISYDNVVYIEYYIINHDSKFYYMLSRIVPENIIIHIYDSKLNEIEMKKMVWIETNSRSMNLICKISDCLRNKILENENRKDDIQCLSDELDIEFEAAIDRIFKNRIFN